MNFLENNKNVAWIFLLLVVVIYGQTLWGDYVFDDRGIVNLYQALKNPFALKQIFLLPYAAIEAGLYRPVALLSYSLNFLFTGTSPFGFHLVNIILYWLLCLSIFRFLEKLFKNRSFALATSLIFLVLPIHTEVVANIIGRAEIMALLFSVLLLKELLNEKINHYKVGLFLFLALGSKETAIAVLPIALLVIYAHEKYNLADLALTAKNIASKYLYPILASLTATVLYFCLRLIVLGPEHFVGIETTIVENKLMFTDGFSRFYTALQVFAMYLGKSIVPINLCSDYSYSQISTARSIWQMESLVGLAVLIFLAFSIFYFVRKRPEISLGSAIFIFSFLPVSNLFFPIGTIAGERLMFFPSLGLCMLLAYFALKFYSFLKLKWPTNSDLARIFYILFISILALYSLVSIARARVWLSEKRLFTNASICAPKSVLSTSNLGTVYYIDGNLKEAEKVLLQSVDIYPKYSKGLNNLGLVYWKMGEIEKAKEFYLKAMATDFPYPGAYENMALLYLSQGDLANGRKWLMQFFSDNKQSVDQYLKNVMRNNYSY